MGVTVSDVVMSMERSFPPKLKEEWDRVGLVVGAPEDPVTKIGFAVDPCEATVNEALERGAQMLITHHPLFLRGTSSVAATSAKGRWVHNLIRGGVALFAAHTNADAASRGSGTALADLLNLTDRRPLEENPDEPELGLGIVGTLPMTMSVREVAQRLQAMIPETPAGITIGGDPEAIVRTVALCSGSGDSFFDQVRASGSDVYITADLRHHPATDHLWGGGCPLIGLTHFASEWPLLVNMRDAIVQDLSVETYISTLVTDPWSVRL